MMLEMLRDDKASSDQVLMFNLLPVLSNCLRSEHSELKHAGLLAMAQLSSKKVLSKQYVQAFVKQTIMTV